MQPDQIYLMALNRIAEDLHRAERRRSWAQPDVGDTDGIGGDVIVAVGGRRSLDVKTLGGAGLAPGLRPRPRLRPRRRIAVIGSRLSAAALAAARAVRTAWRWNAQIQQAILDAQRPWEHEGPLRWQGSGSRSRLVGLHLPCPLPPPAEEADGARAGQAPGSTLAGAGARRRAARRAGFRPSSSPRRSL